MVSSRVVVLLALVVPVGARAATDEPAVTVDESSSSSQPTPEPAPLLSAPPAETAAPAPVPSPSAPPSAPAVESSGAVGSVASTPTQSGTGVGLEFGYARGGDRLVTVYMLDPSPADPFIKAGNGVFVSLTGNWTPLWREGFGLGLYASAGVKYANVSDGFSNIAFTRYPIAAAAQLLVPASEKWFVLARAGLLTEVGAKLSGDGTASDVKADFAPRVGGFADAGVQRAIGRHLAVAVLVRYTYLDVSRDGGVSSANNLGAGLGFSFSR